MRKRQRQCSFVPRSMTSASDSIAPVFCFGDDRNPTAWSKSAFISTRRMSPPVSTRTSVPRTVSYPERLRKVREFGKQLLKYIAGPPKKQFVEHCHWIVGIQRQVADRGLYEVLEEVGPE